MRIKQIGNMIYEKKKRSALRIELPPLGGLHTRHCDIIWTRAPFGVMVGDRATNYTFPASGVLRTPETNPYRSPSPKTV